MQPPFRFYTRLLLLAGLLPFGYQAGAQNMPQPQDAGPSGSVTNTITLPPALQVPASGLNYVRRWAPMIPLTDPAGLLPASDPAYAAVATEYKDGFNRSLQTVQVVDLSKSVVTVADNRFIPQQYSFLPYVSGSTNFRSNAFQEQKSYYTAQYPNESAISYGYAENSSTAGSYQASSYAPGMSQAGQGRATRSLQGTNGANEVRVWGVDASGNPVSSGYYGANQLFLQTVVAPAAGSNSPAPTSKVYKDKEGHVVLEQKADSSYNGNGNYTFASTYYVYDDMGLLRYVLPPKATQLLEQNGWAMTTTILNNLCFQYRYDDRGRQIAVQTPGESGFTEIVYDRKDRAVMRRSPREAGNGQWELSFYDAQGRIKATALYENSTGRSSWQAVFDNSSSSDLSPWLVDPSGEAQYPGDNAVTGLQIMSYTWYDDYSNTDPNDDHWNDAQATLAFSGELQSTSGAETPVRSNRTQGMVTGTQVRIIRSEHADADVIGEWRSSIPYYDDKGRVISSVSWSWYNGDPSTIANIQYTATQYDFAGRARITKHIVTNEKDATGSPETHTERTRYTYDVISGRLSQTTHKMDNGGWTQLNAFTYDDMGRVQRKIIGNNGEVQDFSYNIRGQLAGINGLYAETGEKNGYSRSFGESLKYDYGFSQPRYDGKIAGMIWRGSDVSRRHAYGYGYDLEGRLKTADYNTESTTSVPEAYWTNSVLDYSVSNLFYDKNGNILSMKQRGVKPGSGPIDMDVLGYQYEDGGQSNRLAAVTDNAAATAAFNLGDFQDGNTGGADYSYDANGNLSTDLNKSISDPITYTWFNKPVKVAFPGNETIEFSYDAAGNKIQELQVANNKQTDYIGNFVFENRKLSYVLTAEGRTNFDTDTEDSVREEFFVKDHLGNVRSVTNVYTYNPIQYLATYEVASAGLENLIFNNIDDVRAEKPSSTDPGDIKAAMLDGATNPVGTSLLVKVMAGDQVGMNVNNFYQEYDPGDDNPLSADDMLENIIGTLTGGVGGVTGGESHDTKLVSQLFNSHSYTEVFNGMLESFTDPGRPKAYLNYMFFDENMHLIPDQSGAWQVNGNGTWESIGTGNDGPRLVRQNGYLAVFLTNRSRGGVCTNCSNVYFDWLDVTITKGQLLEENHYYPHGLPVQGLTGVASGFTEQRRKYQSNEYIKDLGLNWMDFNARQYDPQIGRFLSVDPLADAGGQQIWSPYAAMGNAPESMVDPNGTIASINTSDADAIRMVINSLVHNYGDHVEDGAFVSDDASAYKAKEDFQKAMDNMDAGGSGSSGGMLASASNDIAASMMGGDGGDADPGGGNGSKQNLFKVEQSAHYDYISQLGGEMNGVIIDIWYYGKTPGYSKLNWVQNFWTTNSPNDNDHNGTRQPDGEQKPFYYDFDRIGFEKAFSGISDKETHFHDEPGRAKDFSNYAWEAEVSLVGFKNGEYHEIITFRWGFLIPAPNVIIPYWYQSSPSSEQLKSIKNAK